MKSILVTGGAGFVGSHTCKALAAAGYCPVTFDNLSQGHESAVQWGPLEIGDILDHDRLGDVFAAHDPEAVIHFAGSAYVGESVIDPGKYYRNNVTGSLTLIETMLKAGVNRLVFSSSCATYGIPDTLPILETCEQKPINPYGYSKLVVERIMRDFGRSHSLQSIALRYFNAAGSDPDGDIGEDHDPETHLIPLTLDAASGGTPLTIFGDDYDTPDGTCIRDYIHVTDLAEAHVRALNAIDDHDGFEVFNLGTSLGHSILEVIDMVNTVTGLKVCYETGARRPGDPASLVADPSKAQNQLQWRPRLSGLEDIIRTAWSWRQSVQDTES
ncbi:MAG: UDP-glucose 4-epimerase GalE [Rhizobiaceae bacterium]